jgi:hypothetical protein
MVEPPKRRLQRIDVNATLNAAYATCDRQRRLTDFLDHRLLERAALG